MIYGTDRPSRLLFQKTLFSDAVFGQKTNVFLEHSFDMRDGKNTFNDCSTNLYEPKGLFLACASLSMFRIEKKIGNALVSSLFIV